MKKLISLILCGLLLFSLGACENNSNKCKITIGKSVKFSEEEINNAMDCVNEKFKDFGGCTLIALWYDEEKRDEYIENFFNNAQAENVIVLLSNFDVDSAGGDGSFEPNSTYYEWSWELIRDSKTGDWKVNKWGYS